MRATVTSRVEPLTDRAPWKGLRPIVLLLSAGLLLATSCALLGRWWWLFELTTHFRVQYAVLQLLLLPVLLWMRRPLIASATLAALLANAAPTAGYWPRDGAIASASSPQLRIATVNVNVRNRRHAPIIEYLRAGRPDLFALIETDERWLEAIEPLHTLYPHRLVVPRDNSFGIALYSRLPLLGSEQLEIGDPPVSALHMRVALAGKPVSVFAVHTSWPLGAESFRARNAQLAELAQRLRKRQEPVVVIGDLNVSPWSPFFRRFLATSQLQDSAAGRGILGTWPSFVPPLRIPIDHCLFSADFTTVERRVGPRLGSDHLPLDVTVELTGPG